MRIVVIIGLSLLLGMWILIVINFYSPTDPLDCLGSVTEYDVLETGEGQSNSNDQTQPIRRFKIQELHRLLSSDMIPTVAYSYDGQLLAVGDGSKIAMYDQGAQLISSLQLQQSSRVLQIEFNLTFPQIAVLVNVRNVLVFDLTDFTVLKSISYDAQIMDISFTRNGDQLIISGLGDIGIEVWDTLSYNESSKLDYRHTADSISSSPVSNCIAVAEAPRGTSGGAQQVAIIELSTGRSQVLSKGTYNGQVLKVIYDSSGSMLASFDKGLQFWNIKTMQNYRTYPEFYTGNWGPDANMFIGVKADPIDQEKQHIVIFESDSGEYLGTAAVNTTRIRDIVMNPDHKTFATTSEDGTVIIWQIELVE